MRELQRVPENRNRESKVELDRNSSSQAKQMLTILKMRSALDKLLIISKDSDSNLDDVNKFGQALKEEVKLIKRNTRDYLKINDISKLDSYSAQYQKFLKNLGTSAEEIVDESFQFTDLIQKLNKLREEFNERMKKVIDNFVRLLFEIKKLKKHEFIEQSDFDNLNAKEFQIKSFLGTIESIKFNPLKKDYSFNALETLEKYGDASPCSEIVDEIVQIKSKLDSIKISYATLAEMAQLFLTKLSGLVDFVQSFKENSDLKAAFIKNIKELTEPLLMNSAELKTITYSLTLIKETTKFYMGPNLFPDASKIRQQDLESINNSLEEMRKQITVIASFDML